MHILVSPSINFNLSIFIYDRGTSKMSVDESEQKYKGCDNAHLLHVLVALFVYWCIVFGCVCEHFMLKWYKRYVKVQVQSSPRN